MSEIKPCPFCGLHVELVSAKTYPNGERSPSYIKCKRCNYHIAGYEDKDVISQWNTRSAIRKEFCPNCEAETPCTHEAELFVCDICGEDFAKYIVSRNCTLPDVSMTQDVLTDIKTPCSIENNNPDYYKDELYLDEDFRMLAKTYPADVSAIGVTALIDYVEALEAELARRDEELKITDGLLKEATETIGAVIACCTYNSNNDAKIGVYGIDQNAFTRIDKFITHYNDAVSARQVSVDVKTSTDNNKGE